MTSVVEVEGLYLSFVADHCHRRYAQPLSLASECTVNRADAKTVVTCKIKHLQKCFRAVDFPRLCRGSKNVVKMFYFTCNHGLTSKFGAGYSAELLNEYSSTL